MAQTAQQGVFRGETLDGTPALFGFRRLGGDTRWAVVVSAPLDAYNRSWQRPLIGLASGVAVALALGLLAARWLAARLLAPVSDLVQHARAVAASGGDVEVSAPVAPASIAEFEELRTAIETSDGALRRRAETERRAAVAAAESEARQAALMREVDHRAKNALAVVQAVIRLAPPDEPKRFAAAMETRVMALSRAHVLLAAKGWDGAALREVAEAGLSAVPAAGDAVELDGPDITIDPQAVQAVALVLHELAKMGMPTGAPPRDGKPWARLSWEVNREAATLELEWRDSLHADQSGDDEAQGFGGRIVNALVKAQLGGIVSARPEQDGRVVSICLPAKRVMARPKGGVAGEAA
jgi:two-component sensor histidine kinase